MIFIFAEEATIYGSGSGSGDGDVTDDTESSGDGSIDNNGYKPYPPNVYNNVPNEPTVIQTKSVKTNSSGGNGGGTTAEDSNDVNAAYKPQMSLTRALITYLFPIVVVWFGGCFSELL